MFPLCAASDAFWGKGETMLSRELIVTATQGRPPAIIEGSGRKARGRIEHFLRAAIDNDAICSAPSGRITLWGCATVP